MCDTQRALHDEDLEPKKPLTCVFSPPNPDPLFPLFIVFYDGDCTDIDSPVTSMRTFSVYALLIKLP
jgi:hypothetical protein